MPTPRIGLSEQTFCLIRYEICATTRKLNYMPLGDGPCKTAFRSRSLEEKEQIVKDLRDRVEAKYLVYCQSSGPLYTVAATVARLIVAKMGLIIYSPHLSEGLPQSIKDQLFIASIEIMEYSQLLETEASTKKWGWVMLPNDEPFQIKTDSLTAFPYIRPVACNCLYPRRGNCETKKRLGRSWLESSRRRFQ